MYYVTIKNLNGWTVYIYTIILQLCVASFKWAHLIDNLFLRAHSTKSKCHKHNTVPPWEAKSGGITSKAAAEQAEFSPWKGPVFPGPVGLFLHMAGTQWSALTWAQLFKVTSQLMQLSGSSPLTHTWKGASPAPRTLSTTVWFSRSPTHWILVLSSKSFSSEFRALNSVFLHRPGCLELSKGSYEENIRGRTVKKLVSRAG